MLSGCFHPSFGDGSLIARCLTLAPPPEPFADDREFLRCLALAAHVMLVHSGG